MSNPETSTNLTPPGGGGATALAEPISNSPAIFCSDLVRIFATKGIEVQALQGLNLRVNHGELVAVVGASGSGKSTLLSILSGLDTPTAGIARVSGVDLLSMTKKQKVDYRRHTVGFIWQQTARNLIPFLTAAENISTALVVAGAKKRKERVAELVELLGLGELAGRKPGELSGGQQQRVAIAVALANKPSVLLADEPTGELDEQSSAEVFQVFEHVNQELGVTGLIVTHDQTVASHVRRTVQIRDGRTATEVLRSSRTDEEGNVHHITEEYAVLDKAGRMQLPKDFVEQLELKDRVRLGLEPDHVSVWKAENQ
ncbi:MAG: ABC transporter ATP-binding protein [Microbacteriaceae bacterium]|nr:ABC transporter ATP-binding protein [Microbacteriaceae bacterium]